MIIRIFFALHTLGLKFIASDFEANDQGEQHYSVQSFLVTPEELALLKSSNCTNVNLSQFIGGLEIDVTMFRQLSEAGITVGRHFDISSLDVMLDNAQETDSIQKCAQLLNCNNPLDIPFLTQLFHEIKMLVNCVQGNGEGNSTLEAAVSTPLIGNNGLTPKKMEFKTEATEPDCGIEMRLIDMLADTVIDCVRACASSQQAGAQKETSLLLSMTSLPLYEVIGSVLVEKFQILNRDNLNINDNESTYFSGIRKILTSSAALQMIVNRVVASTQNVADNSTTGLLNSIIRMEFENDSQILANLCTILQNIHENEFIDTLRSLFESDPKILYDIVHNVRINCVDQLLDDNSAAEILKNSIVSTVHQLTNSIISDLHKSLNKKDSNAVNYMLDTMSLAKALGLTDCVHCIANILNTESNETILDKIKSNRSLELLQRVIIMHRLSKTNSEWQKSLELLRNDPFRARNDSRLCDLLRLSTISLMTQSQRCELNETNAVPISMFYMNNQLLIEDFVMQKQVRTRGVFLICKDTFQAVVPRESSHDVLIGKCAYTMLDENGIRHFEPMHVYSALHVKNKPLLATRFSMYSCNFVKDDDVEVDIDSIIAMSLPILPSSSKLYTKNDDLVKEAYLPNSRYKTTISPQNRTKNMFSSRFAKQVCNHSFFLYNI